MPTLNLFWKLWYPLVTRLTQKADLTFLNYGFASDNPPTLSPQDEPNRPCIQLYHKVASQTNLAHKTLLEISSGHGGGASYITRTFHPASYTALDRNPKAIAFCKSRHQLPNLTFKLGNALSLPFADNSFDAVLNVEASHCYPDAPRFFAEVTRVLRPNGHFLYTDFRETHTALPLLTQQLAHSGLRTLACTNITPQVLAGMNQNHARYSALIQKLVPRILHPLAKRFAGIQGSTIYNELLTGKTTYLLYHLQKP